MGDRSFRVVQRLLGPTGENLKHITEESRGAKVWICGRGSRRIEEKCDSNGPLTICISADSQSSLQLASELAHDLVRSTHEDYARYWEHQDFALSSSDADAKLTAPHDTYACSFEVGIEEDASFQVVKRLVGKGGKHMKRIEKESEGA